MAASYEIIASAPTILVVSPTLVVDVIQVTIRVSPSGAIVSMPQTDDLFGTAEGNYDLGQLAVLVEDVLSAGKATSATGGQSIDASGLLQDTVTFTVSYKPPGSILPPLTVEVTEVTSAFNVTQPGWAATLLKVWLADVDAAYKRLASAGTPAAEAS